MNESLEGVAIIGMAGRFPGAGNVGEFWRNLRDGVESIRFFSDAELESAGVPRTLLDNPNYVKARAVLGDIELFDAAFFGLSPREAETMDPQHRLFMECAWQALESAGYTADKYSGRIGLYAGVAISNYLIFNLISNTELINSSGDFQILLGNDKDYLATRISYKLNLKGPSVAVQTSCSSSLVAVHLACQSLLNYQTDIALAGGISIGVKQQSGYLYQEEGILSPDGHCRAFDANAAGTVGGNGLGIVVLKRLEDALADDDTIHAVVKGSAINNDGSVKVGYTAPSVEGQAEVIAEALAVAGCEAGDISCIEAHGTGTALGDPIEVAALNKVFRAGTKRKNFCALGSVKTNVGHLDTASGVTGLIKTALALEHKQIPPSLNYESPSPQANLEDSPFYVNTRLAEWETDGQPRRAGVSSFGIGGTNAHVIVEEAPPRESLESSASDDKAQLLVLSARSETALDTATSNLLEHLQQNPQQRLADVAYTLQVGRKDFTHRRTLVCLNTDDAIAQLAARDRKVVLTGAAESGKHSVVFMFSGQGAQYVNMGLGLYLSEPKFREEVDRCSSLLRPHLGFDLKEILYPPDEQSDAATERLNQTAVTQPALFVIEYALASLLISRGIEPEAMMGHSIGEYVAACLADVFSLETALALVAARGRLMQRLPAGAMLAVSLEEETLRPLLASSGLEIAAVNAHALCTISGPIDAVERFERQLDGQDVAYRRLHTSHAFHSRMMEPILAPFIEELKSVRFKAPRIPYISNVTGTWIKDEEALDPRYWARHLRQTVRFADGVGELLKSAGRILLEIGPGQTLSTFAKQHAGAKGRAVLSSMRHPHEQTRDELLLLGTLGRLWLAGAEPQWTSLHTDERCGRIPLPTYPFERQRYWIEPQWMGISSQARSGPLEKKPDLAEWFYVPSWKQQMPPELFKGPDLSRQKYNWLIFMDEPGLGQRIVEHLEKEGQHVIIVKAGEGFARQQERVYTINPRQRDDYEALLQELGASHVHPEKILHLWSVTQGEHLSETVDLFEQCQERGFYSLLFLAQALGKWNAGDSVQIGVVSNNMQEVSGEDQRWPEKATLLGPCKVIPQEYLNLTCQSLDIELVQPGSWKETKLAAQLIAELVQQPTDLVVAYRANNRWVQSFEAVRLEAADEREISPREGGVYLITGGLGDIGLLFADHLARTSRAKLALVGRSRFPERDEWDSWLANHDGQDGTSVKIRKLQAIENHGGQIMVFSADVAAEEQMREVVAGTEERFGPINGVIHGAGVVGVNSFRAIQELSVADCEQQFRAKVYGTKVLEKIFAGREPDFCLLQSSLAAVLGGLGYFAYSAANLYMDALAHTHNQAHARPWLSINWDGWQLVEEADHQASTDIGITLTRLTINAQEGLEALQRILSGGINTQVTVSTADLQSRIEQWIKLDSSRASGDDKNTESVLLHERPNLPNEYVPPRDEREQSIIGVWQELLGIEPIGIHDNFFELGGHSLLGTQVISRLRQKFHVEVPLRSLFEMPTVAELTGVIEESIAAREESRLEESKTVRAIAPRLGADPVPLSFAQERLWFLHQLDPDNSAYNISFALRLMGQLNIQALERSVSEITRRHEVLRTTFAMQDDVPVQVISEPAPVQLPIEDLTHLPPQQREEQARQIVRKEARRPFDLARGPLFRASLLRLSDEEHVALVMMHHIVSDGWSMGVLVQEVATLYDAYNRGDESPLEELPIQYADYALWQREWLQGEVLEEQLNYWREQLAGAPPVLELPTDRPRPAVQSYRGSSEQLMLSAELSERLGELSRREGVTLFMLLLAAFETLLLRYTGQKDMVISTSIAGRNRTETEGLIGFFINQLMLRADLKGNPTFRQLLQRVRETTLSAYAHQDLPFEKVLEELQPERVPGRAPLAQVLFVLQNAPVSTLELPGLTLDTLEIADETSKLDLILAIAESPRGLGGAFEYNTDLFDASTIKRMVSHFETLLGEIVKNPDQRLLDIPLQAGQEIATAGVAPNVREQFTDDQFIF